MPLSTDLRRLLQDVTFSQVEFKHPAIDELLAALRESNTNGGAYFGTFTTTENTTLDWLMSRNRLETVIDRAPILQSDAVFNAFSDLIKEPRILHEPKFEGVSDLTFTGELACQLRFGGAYKSIATLQALELADNFRRCLFQDRYDDVCIVRSFTPWNSWFCDVAWDQTWVIADKRQRRISIMISTDSD